MDKESIVKAGIFGTVVGDALGVPVEFRSRYELRSNPVTDMREYGTHNQPKGTWSDDSSMMLATLDSIISCGFIDYKDIMGRFKRWLGKADYTAYGKVFDVGITCSRAINRYGLTTDPLECGGTGDRDNGNGSLMRIMPASLYVCFKEDFRQDANILNAAEKIHNVSRLTHGHPRSQVGCMIYTAFCRELIYREDRSVIEALRDALGRITDFYDNAEGKADWYDNAFKKELFADSYGRLGDLEGFRSLPESAIRSGGYIVDTLEAAVWCLLNTDSFDDCLLKAVNLGDDTDTVAAVAGGLAGLCYGYGSIPKDWLDVIAKKEWIGELCEEFSHKL